ncbi:hypothetical protein ACUY4R_004044 [Kosakonia sp. BK9b]
MPGQHIAGTIPAKLAGDNAIGVRHGNQLPLGVITISDQQTTFARANLVHRSQSPEAGFVCQFHVQRFVITGDARQLALFVPAVIVGVFMAIVDALDAPLTRSGGIWLIDMVLTFAGLHGDDPVRAGKNPHAIFRVGDHVADPDFAQSQFTPAHIAEDHLVIRQAQETGFKRHHPAGSKHAGGTVAAVIDALPVKRHAIRQHKIKIFFFGEHFAAKRNMNRKGSLDGAYHHA